MENADRINKTDGRPGQGRELVVNAGHFQLRQLKVYGEGYVQQWTFYGWHLNDDDNDDCNINK